MLSPSTFRTISLTFLCLLFLSVHQTNAQCDPPEQLPTVFCVDAPLTCLNDACYSTSNQTFSCCQGFCGNQTVIHNPQYFMVIVTDPTIDIQIHVDDCPPGANGLQSALVSSCDWMPCPNNQGPCEDILDCDPGTNEGGTMFLSATGLTVPDTLWVLIDGSNGALCQYTITYASGIYEPQIEEELDEGEAMPDVVCQGYDDLYLTVGPSIPNAHGYLWNFEWDNSNLTSTLPELTMDVPNNAPAGTWEVCVLAFSGCDTSDVPLCFDLEIVEVDDVEKEPASFCPEEFPFSWHGITISGDGTYRQTFDNEDGCPYDSIWMVEEYPEVPVGQVDVLFCMNENFDPYFYEGEAYDVSGTYDLEYPGMGLNGCDSTAELNLTMIGLDAFIDIECQNGEFVLTVLVQEVIPANAQLTYEWFDGGSTPIFDDNPLLTLEGGTYEVFVTVSTPQGDCVFALEPFSFDADAYKPDPPMLGHGDISICAEDGVMFTVIEDPFMDPVTYVWGGPPGVEVYDDGTATVTMDFSFTTGGQVCVFAVNECGDGPPTCFNVDIQPSPVADFSYEPDVCVNEVTTITFTGSASPNAEVTWNFDGATIVSGSGLGPFQLSWSVPGDKVIDLLVIEPGCDTAFASAIISVTNFLAPTINCSSTISSVSFDWNDVAGAAGYMIVANGGTPFSVPTSDWDSLGLPPGTMIDITLTVISGGPCPDIVLMSTCTAENCPPPVIELMGQDSFCLNSPTIVNLTAVVDGNPGTGTWSGPGITNGSTGTFDPSIAGAGQHNLTYTVDVNGCPFSSPFVVTVFDLMTADFTVDPLICITDMAMVTFTGIASGSAMYNWDFGTATVVSGSGPGPYQLRYATSGQKTVRLTITHNGCSSSTVTQNLDVAPELVAPAVGCMANTSSVEFSWPNNPNVTYTPSVLSGHGGTLTGNNYTFNGLVPGDIVEIEIITSNSGPCPPRRDTFDCEARLCPMPLITLTPVADICLYPGTAPVTLQVDVQNGNGVGDWSGTGITNTTTGIFDPVVAGSGNHQITFHYLDDGCDFIETMTINVFDPPSAFINNSNLVLTCAGGNMLTLDGTSSTGTGISYTWSTLDGTILAGGLTSQADVGAPGTYQLLVVSSTGCRDSASVVVTQDANTPITIAGPDKTLTCDSTTLVLGGASSTGVNVVYSWTTPDGNIIGATNGLFITVDQTGEYTLTVRDTSNGCQSLDRVMVDIDTATASITLTPGDTIDCNTPASGVTSVISGNPGDYTFSWSTPDGNIFGSPSGPDITVTQGGTYSLLIENNLNGCQRSADAIVYESDEIIDDVDVSVVNIRCFGEDNGGLVINSVDGGIPPYTYQWSITPQSVDSLSLLSPGSYSLTVTDDNGCSFVETFTISEPPLVTVDIGPNQIVAIDDSVKLVANTNVPTSAIGEIQWTGYPGQNCDGCTTLEFIATSSQTFQVLLTDTSGCVASDSMRLTVIVPKIIYIPNVFSPNDDGINDYFTISGKKNLININYLRIYDRWGSQVFEGVDLTPGVPEQGWDGKFDEKPVQSGVYVYVAELQYEDVPETVTGSITVLEARN